MNATRREFPKSGTVAGAALTLGDSFLHPLGGAESSSSMSSAKPTWVDRPMRWAQLTLVEDDPGKFDLKFWLDYFKRTKSDAVCLSARLR